MGKTVHDHRAAAGIPRQQRPKKQFFYYGNEEFLFDTRNEACDVELDCSVKSKNREEQIFATFLDIKNRETIENFAGEKFQQTPIKRLNLKDIKQRIKDYRQIGKDTSALVAAEMLCKKKFPTHQCALVH